MTWFGAVLGLLGPLWHGGEHANPYVWNWDPFLLVSLGLAALWYGRGLSVLWAKAGRGHGVTVGQATAYYGGLAAVFAALVTPIDALSDALFWMHMLQHLLLIFLAAPLLVVSAAPVALTWGLPAAWRPRLGRGWNERRSLKSIWRGLSNPWAAWVFFAGALWLWHMPALYEAALYNEAVHIFEHLSFLVTALLFWWALVEMRRNIGGALLYLFTTALHSGVLGALITFANDPWYPHYLDSTQQFGLSPLADQQLAGALMWIPAGIVYLLAALVVVWQELQVRERRDSSGAVPPPVKDMPR